MNNVSLKTLQGMGKLACGIDQPPFLHGNIGIKGNPEGSYNQESAIKESLRAEGEINHQNIKSKVFKSQNADTIIVRTVQLSLSATKAKHMACGACKP